MQLRETYNIGHYRDLIANYKKPRVITECVTVIDAWYQADFRATIKSGDRLIEIQDDLGFFFAKTRFLGRASSFGNRVYYVIGQFVFTNCGATLGDGGLRIEFNKDQLQHYIMWSRELLREHIGMLRNAREGGAYSSDFDEFGDSDLVRIEAFLADFDSTLDAT